MSGQPVSILKMSGAGNTFSVVAAGADLQAWLDRHHLTRPELARRLCSRGKIPTDGALFLSAQGNEEYAWDFFNADGSGAEMCGNAARCAGQFVRTVFSNRPDRAAVFHTPSGDVRVHPDLSVELGPVKILGRHKTVALPEGVFSGAWLDTGVPHFVIILDDGAGVSIDICRRLRSHPDFGPAGANITLLSPSSARHGRAMTYERGVENFTRACGTGAVAAAWILTEGAGSTQISMPGGELRVTFVEDHPFLTGPVAVLGKTELSEELAK